MMGQQEENILKIAVLVSGNGTNLQAILDAIDHEIITNAEVSVVISNNPRAYALKRAMIREVDAVCISPKNFKSRAAFNEALLDKIQSYAVDLVVLAGYLLVIPKIMVDAYPNRIINIHPALIPAFCGTGYYGLKIHKSVLESGVKITGATVHFVDVGIDTGPIILQKAVEIREDDTPEVLQQRVMKEAEWIIMPKAINMIANGRVTVKDGRVHIS